MRYDLIALDVDGTLITDEYKVTDRTKDAVRRAAEQGARIVLCTGRGAVSTLPLLEELGLSGTVITHNGASTIDSVTRTTIHEFSYPVSEVETAIRYCRRHGIHFDVNTAFELYVDAIDDEVRSIYAKYYATPIEVGDVLQVKEPIAKFCIAARAHEMEQLMADWTDIGNDRLRLIRSGNYYLDIIHPMANKGNALKALADKLDIPAERVLAIGNYDNDIEMLEFAGLGIAMDNSPDEVKRCADTVTLSNNEEGVALALEKYCI